MATGPAQDRAIDVGADALDSVGGGIEEPLEPDPVEDSSDQAHFDVDLSRAEGRDVAGVDRLLQMSCESGDVVGVALLDELSGWMAGAGRFGGDGRKQLELINVWQEDGGVVIFEVTSIWRFHDDSEVKVNACSIFTLVDGQFTDQRIYVDNTPGRVPPF